MLSNNLKLALRNLRRHRFFAAVNIAGLAVGLAICWLIGLYYWHETNYDRYLQHIDRICAVALDLRMGEEEGRTTNTPPPIGPRLAADYPEIEMAARTFHLGTVVVRNELAGHAPLVSNEDLAFAADAAFLELFGFPMAEGDASSALDNPGSLVLTESLAKKYFGGQPSMGKPLWVNDRLFSVKGIVKDLPDNSSVQFGLLLPIADFKVVERFSWSWIWLQVDTWVKLRQTANPANVASLEAKFPDMVRRYAPAAYERIGQNFEENLQRGDRYDIRLLPLRSLHLCQADLSTRLRTLGDEDQLRMFGIVGGLILLLACVNFMNLSTARSMSRAREVGVRKALGSQREALVGQFLTEALLQSSAAMFMAAALAASTLPFFNELTGYHWDIAALFSPPMPIFAGLLLFLATLLGGLYPAFYLSKFKAGEAMKVSNAQAKGGQSGLRSGLVVFQFAVSIALMLGASGVYKQLEFAQKKSPGLERENVLLIDNARHLETDAARESFRQQLLQLPEVQHATFSTFLPSLGSFGDFYEPEQGDQAHAVTPSLPLSSYLTDASFVPALGIEILEGRNFLPENSESDAASVLLNETAVKAIGWQNPIGKWMRYPGNENQRFQVVGVVRDFHISSVKMPIEPVAIFHESSKTYRTWSSYIALQLRPGSAQKVIEKAGELWAANVPTAPFEHDFLDESFARLYRLEAKTGTVLGVFTGLALFIGCLGLFALAAFTAEQRTKEIGIRKVLGASVAGITGLLAKDFLKLVIVAILIASPIAYYFLKQWLADFAYRTDTPWWMFAFVGIAALIVAFLTVSYQSVKAALTNPVDSLKNE